MTETVLATDAGPQSGSLLNAVISDSISTLNPKIPFTLDADASLDEAIALMQQHRIGAVLVIEGEKLTGILTERDLLFKVLGKDVDLKSTAIREVMTSHPESLTRDDRIIYALNRMTIGGYRHIPLTDAQGLLTGVISVKDIVEYLVGLVEQEVFQASL